MSLTFTVIGYGNIISTDTIHPPIQLDPALRHSIGLVGLYTCNTVRNILIGNNKFYYDNNVITIPTGCYEIDEINSYIKSEIKRQKRAAAGGGGGKKQNKETDGESETFKLRPNNNTLKCEIESIYTIDFTKPDSIGSMLGFSPQILEPNKKHISDKDIEIINSSNIYLDTNITGGAYRNNVSCHYIFEFGLTVAPGYNLVEIPKKILYLPVTVREIREINIRLVDDRGFLVPFSNHSKTSVWLHLKSE